MPKENLGDEMITITLRVECWATILLALAALIESREAFWDDEERSKLDLDALIDSMQRPGLETSITPIAQARRTIMGALGEKGYRTAWASERYDAIKGLELYFMLNKYI